MNVDTTRRNRAASPKFSFTKDSVVAMAIPHQEVSQVVGGDIAKQTKHTSDDKKDAAGVIVGEEKTFMENQKPAGGQVSEGRMNEGAKPQVQQ